MRPQQVADGAGEAVELPDHYGIEAASVRVGHEAVELGPLLFGRTFALSSQLTAHLAEYLRGWRPNPAGLLFATRSGTPWDANLVVKRKLHPLLERLGIERCWLHAFRHTNSTLMDRLGAPLKVRQQRLGHSDPRLTLGVYTHIASEDDQRIAEKLGAILRPHAPKLEREGVAHFEQPLVN